MIDKTAKNVVRYRHGNANFTYIEKFDDAEKRIKAKVIEFESLQKDYSSLQAMHR